MNARSQIFENIRRGLGVTGSEAPRRHEVFARLNTHPRGVIPLLGQAGPRERIKIFIAAAKGTLASVAEVASLSDVPAQVVKYLQDKGLALDVRMGADKRLAGMDWNHAGLTVTYGPSDGNDSNAVSMAFAGVAEAGLLALVSGPDNPTTLNFLPDNHIIVVEADKIFEDFESVFDHLRAIFGTGTMPRTMNWIAGPSRSADIAQTLLLGAHGPRSVHVIVVGAGG